MKCALHWLLFNSSCHISHRLKLKMLEMKRKRICQGTFSRAVTACFRYTTVSKSSEPSIRYLPAHPNWQLCAKRLSANHDPSLTLPLTSMQRPTLAIWPAPHPNLNSSLEIILLVLVFVLFELDCCGSFQSTFFCLCSYQLCDKLETKASFSFTSKWQWL